MSNTVTESTERDAPALLHPSGPALAALGPAGARRPAPSISQTHRRPTAPFSHTTFEEEWRWHTPSTPSAPLLSWGSVHPSFLSSHFQFVLFSSPTLGWQLCFLLQRIQNQKRPSFHLHPGPSLAPASLQVKWIGPGCEPDTPLPTCRITAPKLPSYSNTASPLLRVYHQHTNV